MDRAKPKGWSRLYWHTDPVTPLAVYLMNFYWQF